MLFSLLYVSTTFRFLNKTLNALRLFFSKLLEGDCFPCVDAEQCSNMGFYADKSPGRGIMYLATREEEPFCGKFKQLL